MMCCALVGLVVGKGVGGRDCLVLSMKLMRWPWGSVAEKVEYPGPITSQRWTITKLGLTWIFWALRYLRSPPRLSVSKTTSASKFEGTGEGAANSARACCEFREKALGDVSLALKPFA